MENKQIIMDGVDVNRCRFYDDRNGYCDACKDDIDGTSFTKCMYEDNCYYKQKEKYKNALKEIREIAEPFCNACLEFEQEKNCSNCIYCNYANILQKISEVLNA